MNVILSKIWLRFVSRGLITGNWMKTDFWSGSVHIGWKQSPTEFPFCSTWPCFEKVIDLSASANQVCIGFFITFNSNFLLFIHPFNFCISLYYPSEMSRSLDMGGRRSAAGQTVEPTTDISNEPLTYGDLPIFDGFPIPPQLMERSHLSPTSVMTHLIDWLTSENVENYRAETFFGYNLQLLQSRPASINQLRALRLLVMAQFFMRHPTFERTSRGDYYIFIYTLIFIL